MSYKLDPTTIIAFVTMIIDAIKKCRENRSRADVMRSLAEPGWMERFIIRRTFKRELLLRGSELSKATREMMGKLKNAQTSQVVALMDVVDSPNFRGDLTEAELKAILGD